MFYFHVHKSPPPIRVLSHLNLVHTLHHICLKFILILSSHVRLRPQVMTYPVIFRKKTMYAGVHKFRAPGCPGKLILYNDA